MSSLWRKCEDKAYLTEYACLHWLPSKKSSHATKDLVLNYSLQSETHNPLSRNYRANTCAFPAAIVKRKSNRFHVSKKHRKSTKFGIESIRCKNPAQILQWTLPFQKCTFETSSCRCYTCWDQLESHIHFQYNATFWNPTAFDQGQGRCPMAVT